MTVETVQGEQPPSKAEMFFEIAYAVFQRILSVCFLAGAFVAWAWAVGAYPGLYGFDRLDTVSRIYISVLAVMLPVASVGLWTTLSWGRVVWLMVVTFQLVFIYRWPGLFQWEDSIVTFHLISVLLYVSFELFRRHITKKA